MRRDIAKVVFERAKGGRTWASKTPRANQVVLDPGGEQLDAASNHIRRERQSRNANLGPLAHFWDKVYSQICASADARSNVGAEVRDGGEREGVGQHYGDPQGVRCGLYVHPTSGLLMRIRERK